MKERERQRELLTLLLRRDDASLMRRVLFTLSNQGNTRS